MTAQRLIPMRSSRWSEDAVVIFKVQGRRNRYGEYTGDREERVAVKCVTHPFSGDSGVLERMPEGARLSDCRTFYVNITSIEDYDSYINYEDDTADAASWEVGEEIDEITVPEPDVISIPDTLDPTNDDAIEYAGRVYDIKEVGEWQEMNFLEVLTLRRRPTP